MTSDARPPSVGTAGKTPGPPAPTEPERYDHAEVEPRWQRYWDEHQTFASKRTGGRPKLYLLDMFPYPSGAGLHVGHPLGFIGTDVFGRYKRMTGFNVLHTMGFDA